MSHSLSLRAINTSLRTNMLRRLHLLHVRVKLLILGIGICQSDVVCTHARKGLIDLLLIRVGLITWLLLGFELLLIDLVVWLVQLVWLLRLAPCFLDFLAGGFD